MCERGCARMRLREKKSALICARSTMCATWFSLWICAESASFILPQKQPYRIIFFSFRSLIIIQRPWIDFGQSMILSSFFFLFVRKKHRTPFSQYNAKRAAVLNTTRAKNIHTHKNVIFKIVTEIFEIKRNKIDRFIETDGRFTNGRSFEIIDS